MSIPKLILVVDDDDGSRQAICTLLDRTGYNVVSACNGREGLEMLQVKNPDVVITDLVMPDLDGLEILRRAKEMRPEIEVFMLTGFGSIETAVSAMRDGAYDYITKPINILELREKLKKAIEKQNLALENKSLLQQIESEHSFDNIIGKSAPMTTLFDKIRQIAPSRANVLISGPSGTGKELIANAICYNSNRKEKPFVKFNCAALAESLAESELFGHEKGSFTGAATTRIGKFELANTGTLMLDEIGEMSLSLQAKLLRAIEQREIVRVGGNKTINIDVRFLFATNRNLKQDVQEKKFREDLYYRLNVVALNIPPLKDRRDDIPLLINAFLLDLAEENNREKIEITPEALNLFKTYDWPGNVRELKNTLEGIIVIKQENIITPDDLPYEISQIQKPLSSGIQFQEGLSMEDIEKEVIRQTLMKSNGNKTKAANALKISLRTLHRKITTFNLK